MSTKSVETIFKMKGYKRSEVVPRNYRAGEDTNKKGRLDAATELGPVHLLVTSANRALRFYRDILGMRELSTTASSSEHKDIVSLGSPDGTELVVLHPGATGPFPEGRTGLCHLALAVPNLRELARVAARLSSLKYDQYLMDHVISKSDYLWDPDGNGIEVYKETPEDVETYRMDHKLGHYLIRDKNGILRSGIEPLDLDDWIYRHLTSNDSFREDPISEGTTMGHVHLHVADLDSPIGFYRDVIGYNRLGYTTPPYLVADLTLNNYDPHRIALNIWAGEGAPPASPGASGLRHFTIFLPNASELDALIKRIEQSGAGLTKDPSNNHDSYYVNDPSKNGIYLTVKEKAKVISASSTRAILGSMEGT
jgi:catechol 2,3-dioxygenase